jgi:hypothetical protein
MKKFNLIAEGILNGLAKNKTLEDIAKKHKVKLQTIKKELMMGLKVEKEHTDSKLTAKKIAMDHLIEDPYYYTKLKKMER